MWGVEYSCIVFNTSATVEQAILVHVSAQQRDDWLRLFKLLSEIHLSFVLIVSGRTFQSSTAIPLETVAWNKLMGSIDTVRKIACGTKARRGPNSKPGTLLWTSLIDYCLYNTFRVYQCILLESKLDHFTSHQKFQAARQGISYPSFLILLQEEISLSAFQDMGLVFSTTRKDRDNTAQPGMQIEAEIVPPVRAGERTVTKVKYKALEKFNVEPLKTRRLDSTKAHVLVNRTGKIPRQQNIVLNAKLRYVNRALRGFTKRMYSNLRNAVADHLQLFQFLRLPPTLLLPLLRTDVRGREEPHR